MCETVGAIERYMDRSTNVCSLLTQRMLNGDTDLERKLGKLKIDVFAGTISTGVDFIHTYFGPKCV